MSIEGRIAIDVGFSDLATADGVQSTKRLSLASTDSYSTGKVAVLSGTCGTAVVAVSVSPSSYRDSSGSVVSFSTVTRFAFAASSSAACSEAAGSAVVVSGGSRVASSDSRGGGTSGFNVASYSGTASYQLVIYGT